MINLVEKIEKADDTEIEKLLKAVLHRYAVLFPNLELGVISLTKESDPNKQIDEMIALLKKTKTLYSQKADETLKMQNIM